MPTTMLAEPARTGAHIPSSRRPYTHRIAQGPWIGERCQLCDLRLQAGEPFVYGAASLVLEEEIYHRACHRQAYGGDPDGGL